MPLGPAFVVPGCLVVERERPPRPEPERPAVEAERDRPAKLLNCGFDDHTTFGTSDDGGVTGFSPSVSIPSGGDDDEAAAAAEDVSDMTVMKLRLR